MAWNIRVGRLAFFFAIAVTMLILNFSQLLKNMRLNKEIGKAARILAWRAPQRRGFDWSCSRRVHTENLRVLKYTLLSSERFRIEVESDETAIAWDARLRSIPPEVDEYYSEYTVVFCRVSPGRFRVHLTGQDGICREFEVDGNFRSIDGICSLIGAGPTLYCDKPHKFISANSDAFRLDVSAEVLCD